MLRIIHISDTHLESDPNFTLYNRTPYDDTRALINHLNNDLTFTPDFIIHTGDVTNNPSPEAYQHAADLLGKLKYPVYYVSGNHDDNALLRQYLLQQPANDAPLFYDFRQGAFHFAVLDSRGDIDPQGYVDEAQLAWLAQTWQQSDAAALVLLVHHLPLKTHIGWHDERMRIMNDAAFFATLAPFKDKLRGVFFGHIHRAFTGFRDGILCSAVASAFAQLATSAEGYPMPDNSITGAYSVITLTEAETTVQHFALPQ